MNNKEIKIVIADDHELFRDGLALMIKKVSDFVLVGQAENGNKLLEVLESTKADVVLTDIKMPELDGIQATRIITRNFPNTKVIALSMFDEDNMVAEMFDAGAKGYLLKNADKIELIQAVKTVHNNDSYFSEKISKQLVKLIVKNKASSVTTKDHHLTEREIEIIKLICKQYTTQQIAEILCLSYKTVENYRLKIQQKMDVRNTAGIVVYALTKDIISEKDL